jgi:hypothetical protein
MAVDVVWPLTLSAFKFTADGSALAMGRNVVSFQPDVGRPIERVRSNVVDDVASLHFTANDREAIALDVFYKTTTLQGTVPFTMIDPDSGTIRRFLFRAAPSFSYMGAGVRSCTLDLLRLG